MFLWLSILALCLLRTDSQNVRLVGSGLSREGRLEVYHNSVWGTVCDDSFSDVDATVVCYELGFGRIGIAIDNQYGPGNGTILLDEVACSGYESSITTCSHNSWGVTDCSHSEDVSVSCYSSEPATTTTTRSTTTTSRRTTTTLDLCTAYCPCSSVSCFPGQSTVHLGPNGRLQALSDLRLGDSVLTVDTDTGRMSFEPVIAFLHRHQNASAEFVIIETESRRVISITGKHLIFRATEQQQQQQWETDAVPLVGPMEAVFADEIRVGHYVYTTFPHVQLPTHHDARDLELSSVVPDRVTAVSRLIISEGVYAPLTVKGTIVVDGVAASCYASFPSHRVSHIAMLPLRAATAALHRWGWLGTQLCTATGQEQGEEINSYANILMNLAAGLIHST